jgi:hypothetical protein
MGVTIEEERLPRPADEIVIFVLGLVSLVTGVPGFPAYFMGRAYRERLARGLVRRSALAEAGYVMGAVGLLVLFCVLAVGLLGLIGVIGLSQLLS